MGRPQVKWYGGNSDKTMPALVNWELEPRRGDNPFMSWLRRQRYANDSTGGHEHIRLRSP
jgi:hypothetical protein